MPWYFFAALTPTLYSISNFIDKFLLDKKIKEPVAITALSSLISGILGIIFLAFMGFKILTPFQTLLIIGSGFLLTLYILPYYQVLRNEDASRVVPLYQFIPVFTLILSAIFLKESLFPRQIVGLVLIVVSGFLLSAEKIEAKIFKPRKALWFMLLSGFMYGLIGILFRFVSKDASFWTVLGYEYVGSGMAGIALFLIPKVRESIRRQSGELKSSLGILTVNEIIAVIAQMSEAYAVTLVAVPLVNMVGGIQPLLTLVIGIVLSTWFPHLIKEDIHKVAVAHKLISIIIIFAGLYLVYF
jgi:drug/metabolite transporter (DMT)-like permease